MSSDGTYYGGGTMSEKLTTLARVMLFMMVLTPVAPVAAQDARTPSAEEIIRRLTPRLAPEDLRNNAVSVEGRRRSQNPGQSPPGAQSASIDLQVNFEYASAVLTADARLVLDNLGQALSDPALRDSRFRIAGHTDARGSDAYNLTLSRQRARSVADYLMQQHKIGAQRLKIEGYGRGQLLDAANPESAVNRRVQIVNLGA
jgi:outer membrane protein OmpA-like peptidoglycan-associated protein